MKKAIIIIALIVSAFVVRIIFLSAKSQEMTPTIGLSSGRLSPCPQKPNCVSSQEDGDHFISPIQTGLRMEEVKKRVLELNNARLESEGDDYAHITFKSELFGFLDDVELYKNGDVLHVRSASRVGHSDMGVNRKRVKLIREILK